jgi:Acetyltransferase (GNAT) domain
MTDEFLVAPASVNEMRIVLEWAAAQGWNPGLRDEAAFHPTDPGGFLIGRLGGEPVTALSVIRYGDGFGFAGLWLTHPAARGTGLGRHTWRTGLHRLAGRTVGLDALPRLSAGEVAPPALAHFTTAGFATAWHNLRCAGTPAVVEPSLGVLLADAHDIGFADLAAYDRRFFPASRDAFLASWITLPGHRALIAVRDGALAGFGVLRPARDTNRVGPLYAASADVAAMLLTALSAGEHVTIDVPVCNAVAVDVVERLGLKPQWESARMYRGGVPDVDVAGLFGVTTLELG